MCTYFDTQRMGQYVDWVDYSAVAHVLPKEWQVELSTHSPLFPFLALFPLPPLFSSSCRFYLNSMRFHLHSMRFYTEQHDMLFCVQYSMQCKGAWCTKESGSYETQRMEQFAVWINPWRCG